jgi:MYXO-CTERM domain-containing protein
MDRHAPRLSALALVLALAAPAAGQVSGVVRDEANQPVADAIVTLQASDKETLTDAAGAYSLPSVTGKDLVIVAAKRGHYYGSVTVTAPVTTADVQLEQIPTTNDPAYLIKAPESCASCHDEQFAQWKDSPMGKAGANTWVYDVYDGTGTPGGQGGFVYTRDSVLSAKNPASECAACHQPELWWNKPYSPLDPLKSNTQAMGHGVSCEVCHKIANIDETKPNFPGLWPGVVDVTKPGGTPFKQVMFGTLKDVTYAIDNTMKAAYQPQLKAAVCAACHQDKNDPDEDGDFEEPNGVVSEPTYQEWLDSPYADPKSPKHATCVDCHMKPTPSPQACTMQFPPLKRPAGDVNSHAFPGTTPEFLENAVTLSLDAVKNANSIEVDVTLENDQTGHHVPTGVTIRNMILLVEAFREQDGLKLEHTGKEVVHELGGVGDPEQGYFAGLPGKLYAKVNGDAANKGPTFFTDATSILWDNRLPPLGKDSTHYSFALPADGGKLVVRARLIYRRSWRALVDAKKWTTDGHGKPLADVTAPHFGHLMEQAEQVFDLPCDAGACLSPDGGVGGTGGTGGGAKPGSDDGGGCGCRAAGGDSAALWGMLAALAFVLGVARRRR